MVKKLFLAAGVALALSNVAWAQTTTPGGINSGASGPLGIGPDISTPVPGTAGTINSRDPRRAPSGSRANDSSPMGTTGGVDAGSAMGGTTDSITPRSPVTGSGTATGSGSIGSGSGVGVGGAIGSGAGTPLPGARGMSGSGSMGGEAATGGAGMGGAGAAGPAGAAGGAR